MKKLSIMIAALAITSVSVWAGALTLMIGNPSANPEAQAQNAAIVARITACHSPEKTAVTATAEGIVAGVHKTIPLKVIALPTAGTFAVKRDWPDQGSWAVKLVATNPDYKDYSTGIVVPVEEGSVQFAASKQYYHAPTNSEVLLALK